MSDFASRHSSYSGRQNKQSVGMSIDSEEVEKMLDFFTSDQCTDLYKKALGTIAADYKKTVKEFFTGAMPSATRPSQSGYKDRLIDAVRVSRIEAEGDEVKTKVHIMGVRSAGSGTFRARFFEGGTKERVTKTGRKAGRIEALNFFQKAENTMQNLTVSLDQVLTNLINKNAPK